MHKVLIIATLLFSSLFSGCKMLEHIPSVKGAVFETKKTREESYDKDGKLSSVKTLEEKSFIQSENPKQQSTIVLSGDGSSKVEMGASFENAISIIPPEDKTKYIALSASILSILLGAFLLSKGRKAIGFRLVAYGFAGAVVSMTIASYGAYYAAAIIALGLFVALEKHQTSKNPTG